MNHSMGYNKCEELALNSKLSVVENIFVKESSVGSDMTVMANLETNLSGRLGVTPRSLVDRAIRNVSSRTYSFPPKASYLH